jgi:hypothetical protein
MSRTSEFYRVVARASVRLGGVDLPGPKRHAARPSDQETLCGAPVEGMQTFEHLPYQELDPVLRCRDCGATFDRLVSGL